MLGKKASPDARLGISRRNQVRGWFLRSVAQASSPGLFYHPGDDPGKAADGAEDTYA
jgi:hypothetical protein